MRFVLTALFLCVTFYGTKLDWTDQEVTSSSACTSIETYRLSSTHTNVSLEKLFEQENIPVSSNEWIHLIEQLNPPSNFSSDMIVYPVWDTSC